MPQAVEESLARRIRAAQELSGKRTQELADELGWDVSKLWRIRRGDQVPDAIELSQIAAATDQRLDFFFSTSAFEGADGGDTLADPPAAVKKDNARKPAARASSGKRTAPAAK